MKKNKKDNKNPFLHLGIGFFHYLRGGAGAWTDKKKEYNRTICRKKDNEDA